MGDASKGTWTIRELDENEYPGTQLWYEVRDAEGEVVSLHHWEEDARMMASVPELQSNLRTALEYIALIHKSESDDAELGRILSALKGAKGEK